MKRLTMLVLLIFLAGCGAVDSATDGFKHAQEVAADLEKSVGIKPLVGFSWSNGSLNNVRVTFGGIPANKSINEIAELSRGSIATHFKQRPKEVVIAFSIPGSARK